MPEWPGLKLVASKSLTSDENNGRTVSFDLKVQPPTPDEGEKPDPVQVPIHVWLPPRYERSNDRYPVVYVQDTAALDIGDWPETLNRVVGRTVAPLIVIFAELPRMPDPDKVFAEQVVPDIDKRYRTHADRDQRALVGMGWDGLYSIAAAFQYPDLYGVLGVQSFYALEDDMSWLRKSLGEKNATSLPLRIYFEWGRWDLVSPHENINMREWASAGWKLLRDRGWEPMGGEVWDSTDWASWRNRTGVMLQALFPMKGVEPNLGAWQTDAQLDHDVDEQR